MFHVGEKRFNDHDVIRIINPGKQYTRIRSDTTKESWYLENSKIIDNYIGINPYGVFKLYTQKFDKPKSKGIRLLYHNRRGKYLIYTGTNTNLSSIYRYNLEKHIVYMDNIPKTVDLFIDPRKPVTTIYTYLDDNVDTVLELLGTKKIYYDHLCLDLYRFREQYRMDKQKVKFSDLRSFMDMAGYWMMVDSDNEIGIDYKLQDVDPNADYRYEIQLSINDLVNVTRKITSYYMYNVTCLKYWYDMDLSTIRREYCLVRDKFENLYVIVYDKGPFCEDVLLDADLSPDDLYTFMVWNRAR